MVENPQQLFETLKNQIVKSNQQIISRLSTQTIAIQTFYKVLANSIQKKTQQPKRQPEKEEPLKTKIKIKPEQIKAAALQKKKIIKTDVKQLIINDIDTNVDKKKNGIIHPKKKHIKKKKKNYKSLKNLKNVNNKKQPAEVISQPEKQIDTQVKNIKSASEQEYSYNIDSMTQSKEQKINAKKKIVQAKPKQEKVIKKAIKEFKQLSQSAKAESIQSKKVIKQNHQNYRQQKQKFNSFHTSYFNQVFQVTDDEKDKIQKKDLLAIYLFWRQHLYKDQIKVPLNKVQRFLTVFISNVQPKVQATKKGFLKIKLKQDEMKEEIIKLKQKYHIINMIENNQDGDILNSESSE